jgi:hypothetical protein
MKISEDQEVRPVIRFFTPVIAFAFAASLYHEITPEKFPEINHLIPGVTHTIPFDHGPHNPGGIVYTMDKDVAFTTSTASLSSNWIKAL